MSAVNTCESSGSAGGIGHDLNTCSIAVWFLGVGKRFISLPKRSDCSWGPPILHSDRHWRFFPSVYCRTLDAWTCIIISLCTFVLCTRTSVFCFTFLYLLSCFFGVRTSADQVFSLRPITAKTMVRLPASNARFVVDEVELVQGSFLILRFSPIRVTLPMIHTH